MQSSCQATQMMFDQRTVPRYRDYLSVYFVENVEQVVVQTNDAEEGLLAFVILETLQLDEQVIKLTLCGDDESFEVVCVLLHD